MFAFKLQVQGLSNFIGLNILKLQIHPATWQKVQKKFKQNCSYTKQKKPRFNPTILGK